jgi:hypothetical protein
MTSTLTCKNKFLIKIIDPLMFKSTNMGGEIIYRKWGGGGGRGGREERRRMVCRAIKKQNKLRRE